MMLYSEALCDLGTAMAVAPASLIAAAAGPNPLTRETMQQMIEGVLVTDRRVTDSNLSQVYIVEDDPQMNSMRVTLIVVTTTQPEKNMPKHVLPKNNPGWIQQRKKRVITMNKKLLDTNTKVLNIQSDRIRAVQTLRLEPVKGAKRFGMITGLLDSGADNLVVSEEVARVLGLTVMSTLVRAYDTGGMNC